jgi:hypothetical protein
MLWDGCVIQGGGERWPRFLAGMPFLPMNFLLRLNRSPLDKHPAHSSNYHLKISFPAAVPAVYFIAEGVLS